MDDEGVFVLQEAGEVLVVNQVGAFVVQQLEEARDVDELVDAITARFAVDDERAKTDATSLLEALVDAGAICRA